MHDKSSREVETDTQERRLWFRQSILPHEAELRLFIQRLGRGRVSVDDLVHDTLVRILTTPNWRQINQPAAFMKTIARNLLTDAQRREKVVTFELLSDSGEMTLDETPNPERTAIDRDELRYLLKVIEALPPHQRRILNMRKIQGLAPEVIANQLGLSVSTVEKHLVKALRFCSQHFSRDSD
jgi:RNA polymerase sigma-70 factor (ECF subfamily)